MNDVHQASRREPRWGITFLGFILLLLLVLGIILGLQEPDRTEPHANPAVSGK